MNTRTRARSTSPLSSQFATGILLAFLMLANGTSVLAAQATSSVTLGNITLTYTTDWELLGEDGENVTLQYEDTAYALFDYSVLEDNDPGASDPSDLIATTRIELLASQDIIDSIHLAERSVLADGTVWELYTMNVNGISIFYLAAANVDVAPGVAIVSTLATPLADLVAAHFAVMTGITVDGEPTLIGNIASDELLGAALIGLDYLEDPRPAVPPAGPAG